MSNNVTVRHRPPHPGRPQGSALHVVTLVELLCHRALRQAGRHAYTFLRQGEVVEAQLTYGELDQRARAIGTLLQRKKATGKPVLLLHPPSLEYIAGFFGCLYAGAIAVPAYPPYSVRTMPRIQAIVADTQANIALTTTDTLPDLQRCFAHVPELEGLEWIATDITALRLADEWKEPEMSGDMVAFLQYTSGSTSVPRGVMVSHSNLLHNLGMIERASGQGPDSHMVSWAPPYHDMGIIAGILSPLHIGYPATLMSPLAFLQRPFRWLQAISRLKATMSVAPNFAYDLCTRKITPEQRATLDLSTWEIAANGAEPIRDETLNQFVAAFGPHGFRREAFFAAYGLAEATLISATSTRDDPIVVRAFQSRAIEHNQVVTASAEDENARKIIGCELQSPDQCIIIVNPETFTECVSDEIGEVWIAGPSVTQGYWGKTEETEHTFRAYLANTGEGPFLRTGDMGFFQEGVLFVTGRLKDMIIVRGRNHYPQDIELTVERCHPTIRTGCCAAFSIDVEGVEQLVVLAEIDPHYQAARGEIAMQPGTLSHRKLLDGQTVIKAIRQAVSEQHELQIERVMLLKAGSVFKTSSGKIQRRACRARFLAGDLSSWDE
ncbi:MAG TPA: fatty acyl-AMP ligase [Ktedonobacteraceae bacterium]|nr:fatty acyl-AMP ligase [Ktedonobacteraceae bacterium]